MLRATLDGGTLSTHKERGIMELYYEPRDEDDGTLWAAPRPLPGTKVGYRAGTGFALYRVEAAYLDEALKLDAQEVKPADDATWAAIVEAAVAADGYSRAEYEAVFMPSDVLPEMQHAVVGKVRRIPVDWVDA